MNLKSISMAVGAAALMATSAIADPVTLRIQTHHAPETSSGKLAQSYIDDIQTMSGGDITVEMFFSSAVVASVETFDAAANGILDCDMTGGAYQTGKNPAFQFVSDIMGGYDTPYQQLSWLYLGGGLEAAQDLYNQYGMQLVGWWIPGPESFASTKPLDGVASFKDWKFRSPPGMETKIFEKLGASPIVIDFTEVFTSLETGIIEGADASSLANNMGMGLYDIAKHANYPGFHSMPSDHLACNKDVWDSLTDQQRSIMEVAMQKLALQTAIQNEKNNTEALAALKDQGVTIWDFSADDKMAVRAASQATWPEFATTPEAKALVESHLAYLGQLGLVVDQ